MNSTTLQQTGRPSRPVDGRAGNLGRRRLCRIYRESWLALSRDRTPRPHRCESFVARCRRRCDVRWAKHWHGWSEILLLKLSTTRADVQLAGLTRPWAGGSRRLLVPGSRLRQPLVLRSPFRYLLQPRAAHTWAR